MGEAYECGSLRYRLLRVRDQTRSLSVISTAQQWTFTATEELSCVREADFEGPVIVCLYGGDLQSHVTTFVEHGVAFKLRERILVLWFPSSDVSREARTRKSVRLLREYANFRVHKLTDWTALHLKSRSGHWAMFTHGGWCAAPVSRELFCVSNSFIDYCSTKASVLYHVSPCDWVDKDSLVCNILGGVDFNVWRFFTEYPGAECVFVHLIDLSRGGRMVRVPLGTEKLEDALRRTMRIPYREVFVKGIRKENIISVLKIVPIHSMKVYSVELIK